MPVEYLEQGPRLYQVTCDKCEEDHLFRAQNKQVLRDCLREWDWIWRDAGYLGITETICPECQKGEKK